LALFLARRFISQFDKMHCVNIPNKSVHFRIVRVAQMVNSMCVYVALCNSKKNSTLVLVFFCFLLIIATFDMVKKLFRIC